MAHKICPRSVYLWVDWADVILIFGRRRRFLLGFARAFDPGTRCKLAEEHRPKKAARAVKASVGASLGSLSASVNTSASSSSSIDAGASANTRASASTSVVCVNGDGVSTTASVDESAVSASFTDTRSRTCAEVDVYFSCKAFINFSQICSKILIYFVSLDLSTRKKKQNESN